MSFCKICDKKLKLINKHKLIKSNLPVFNHANYGKISDYCYYTKCNFCQLISILANKKIKKSIKFNSSKKYVETKQTDQKKIVKGRKKLLYRSELQAEYISKHIKKNKVKILDIGCFDGKLLNYLDSICKKSLFYGYDINPFLEKLFPPKKNFYFLKNLELVNFKFDCIVISLSLQYIKDLKRLLTACRNLIKDDGKIFIQVPDIKKNIFHSLMADQRYIFTENSLLNICKILNLTIKKVDKKYFSREIILILKRGSGLKNKCQIDKDRVFENNLITLKKIKNKLKLKFTNNRYSVLGTTVNAAFIDEVIKKNITHFLDENVKSKNKFFRGKKIQHPKKLKKTNNVIFPYVNSENAMLKRFRNTYKGHFITI